MADLLFLAHRLPYPPNKGDKVRSYHLLKHLAGKHRVHLGTFIDDPDDEQHLGVVQGLCASLHAARLHPPRARLASLSGLLRNEPLTLGYYRDAALLAWARRLQGRVAAVIVFSSSMAQYADGCGVPLLVDFVDVDSAKWTDYAGAHRWPMSWLYRREGQQLLAYERAVAARADHSFFATEKETDLFRSLAPESGRRIGALSNGVDFDHFAPAVGRSSPFLADETAIVFTGAMDYWPNIDAVSWFANDILPALRRTRPALRFHIVGRNPAPAVRALAGDHIHVTGTVPDVRPYLQHAAAVVAPLRLARGIQNKILEAMAMGRPVVTTTDCAAALVAQPGVDLLVADDAAGFEHALGGLLDEPARAAAVGSAGRARVRRDFAWETHFSALDQQLQMLCAEPALAA